jgi:hypothetical protein
MLDEKRKQFLYRHSYADLVMTVPVVPRVAHLRAFSGSAPNQSQTSRLC